MQMEKQCESDKFVDAARRAVQSISWDPQEDLEIIVRNSSKRAVSHNNDQRSRVRLEYDPNLSSRLSALTSGFAGVIPGGLKGHYNAVVGSRVYMSAGSYRICPSSSYAYSAILEACADGLRSAGANEGSATQLAPATASFFITAIVAGANAIDGPPEFGAFRMGWTLDQCISTADQATLPRYSSLHDSIQLSLWSDDPATAGLLRSRFAVPFDALDFETARGIAILLDTFDFSDETRDGLAWRDDQTYEMMVDQLMYHWRSWPIKAFQYAELLGPYFINDENRPPRNQPEVQGGPDRRFGRPSEQAEARRSAVQSAWASRDNDRQQETPLQAINLTGIPLEPFGELFAEDSQFRAEVIAAGAGVGVNPLKYCSLEFDSLDAMYRQRVADMEIKSDSISRAGMALDIAHMSREKLQDGLPSLNYIDWGATRFGPDGELELYNKKLPITHQTPATTSPGGFPDLLLLVDSSGSMSWKPRTGSGQYDSLLRAAYSIFAFLEKRNKAQHMKYAAVNFSGRTLSTPWKPYSELSDIKKLLFNKQNAGTVFNSEVLEELARTNSDNFMCLMVTDGAIRNSSDVVKIVGEMVARGNKFVLIQIGKPSPLVQALRQMTVPVHVITDHRQLRGLCLDYTQEAWGSGEIQ
jgi:hypothetical protein